MNYSPDPGEMCWIGHRAEAQINQTGQRPGTKYDSVRTWISPTDGVIVIDGTVTNKNSQNDGIRARIRQNGFGTQQRKEEVLWEWETEKNGSMQHHLQTEVKAGDVIRFVISRNGGVSNHFVFWDP